MVEPIITEPNSFPGLGALNGRSRQTQACGDVIEALHAAHVRIGHVVSLAAVLSSGSATSSTSAAARAVCDFVAGSMSRHMQDEELTLAPHLAGRHEVVDRALATMKTDHFRINATLARLCGLCGVISRDAMKLNEYRFLLEQVVGELRRQLEQHHELEEAIVFPAVRRLLGLEEISQIHGEMVARRRGTAPLARA